jgi:hypothetical protein
VSFDLYVWHQAQPLTADRAARIYHQLAQGKADTVLPGPEISAFHRDLTTRFPDLERLDDEGLDSSPWAMSPTVEPSHVITMIGWSRAQEMTAVIVELAAQHGLICFNPQVGQVYHPPKILQSNGLHLDFCDGGRINAPGPDDLDQHLRQLSDRNWYACLEGESGWFVQVGIGQNAGRVAAGQFALEYREGSSERHYRTVVASLDDVVRAFSGFAVGDELWKSSFSWSPVF